jgi:hypothetical protein
MITVGELVLNPGQAATSSLVPCSGTFLAVHGMARGRSASHDRLPPGASGPAWIQDTAGG